MSREVRRVPLGWKHPVEHNLYWQEQKVHALSRGYYRKPTMHAEDERFIGLFSDYEGSSKRWLESAQNLYNRTGWDWEFLVEYHLTGFKGQNDAEPVVHPFYLDGDAEEPIEVTNEKHLYQLAIVKTMLENPQPKDYMPLFPQDEADLGWALYETVSEGTPITPTFATADELIDHLSTVGTEWGGPLRRGSAEAIVARGGTLGSVLVMGGQVLNSTEDADKIKKLGES